MRSLFGRCVKVRQQHVSLPTMTTHFANLPSEILILILYNLDFPGLVSCTATNRRVKSIIDSSALLQYRLAAQIACVEDNAGNTSMTSAQRLSALDKRQTAFAELIPTSVRTIQMDEFPILNVYALSGGIFVMTEADRRALRWTPLASDEPTPVWERLEFDEYILEFSLAIPEEDLLVVVTSRTPPQVPLAADATIKLHFLQISTKSAHPRAKEPIIDVSMVPSPDAGVGCPAFELDISGSRVVLLVLYAENAFRIPIPGIPLNRLLVYDWTQGRLQTDLSDNYSAAIFLSADVVLLPQLHTGTLDLRSIPDAQEYTAAGPEISLQLPQLAPHCRYDIARVEYNPKSSDAPSSTHLPFHSSYIDSLVVLQIDVDTGEMGFRTLFLIVPRRALLHQIYTHPRNKCLEWAEWGPPITRWLDAGIYIHEWPTIVCGQRCVFLKPDSSIRLLDFNPHTRNKRVLQWQLGCSAENTIQRAADIGAGLRFISSAVAEFNGVEDLFGEQIHSELAFLGTESRNPTHCKGVFMDEEWIVSVDVSFGFCGVC
ncbi:hypothetical protein C8R47DRAFT_333319 [Mycena vitilis]|nr:hypothetical protein C8R47DRAFT_333319 [Mycena vitilis]